MPRTPTRDRLLDAALRSFATRGVDGTAITDLEEAAGLAPGSGGFYRYFRTKDEILAAVVRREIDRVVAAETEAPSRGGSDRATVEAALHQGFATLRTLGPLMAILAREAGRIPELADEVATRLIERPLGEEGRGAQPARSVVVLTSMVGWELSRRYFGRPPGGASEEELVAALADLLLDDKEPSL